VSAALIHLSLRERVGEVRLDAVVFGPATAGDPPRVGVFMTPIWPDLQVSYGLAKEPIDHFTGLRELAETLKKDSK